MNKLGEGSSILAIQSLHTCRSLFGVLSLCLNPLSIRVLGGYLTFNLNVVLEFSNHEINIDHLTGSKSSFLYDFLNKA